MSARRPCVLADGAAIEIRAELPDGPLPRAITVIPELKVEPSPAEAPRLDVAPLQASQVRMSAPALAHRLRQVREANRPVRSVPGLKRQARDILSKSVVPAAAVRVAPEVETTRLADGPLEQSIRTRPTLVYAA